MNKTLTQAHSKRSHLRNRFLKNRCPVNRTNYIKLQNYCVSLLIKTKKEYDANLNEKDVADNKRFWKTGKSLLHDKVKSHEKATLLENDKINTSK